MFIIHRGAGELGGIHSCTYPVCSITVLADSKDDFGSVLYRNLLLENACLA